MTISTPPSLEKHRWFVSQSAAVPGWITLLFRTISMVLSVFFLLFDRQRWGWHFEDGLTRCADRADLAKDGETDVEVGRVIQTSFFVAFQFIELFRRSWNHRVIQT